MSRMDEKNRAPEAVIHALREGHPNLEVLTDPESLLHYGRDRTRFHDPAPTAIVFPRTIEDVQALIHFARSWQVGIVPSGGRTGLSAGAVATSGELVVGFDRMNTLSRFEPIDRTVVCGPGVITANLQKFATEKGLSYPVDFAASGSSQIGGNIATNAGGINVIRYGMTRAWVAGLKVVTGTGEVLSLNNGLVKNNAGYDLRHLIIGSEGTLGLVVEATMRLGPAPTARTVLFLGAPSMEAVLGILETFQQSMTLNAFEFLSEAALQKVVTHGGARRPFGKICPFYALLDVDRPHEAAEKAVMTLFESCVEAGFVEDGVMSQNRGQAARLWRCREDMSETLSRWTPYKNDISVTVSRAPRFLADIDEVVARHSPDLEVIWYGHLGDGNVHLNVLKPEDMSRIDFLARCEKVSQWVYEVVERYQGSVSAEHGVGLLKKGALTHTRSEEEIRLMRAIKGVFDPDGILNPGKIFD